MSSLTREQIDELRRLHEAGFVLCWIGHSVPDYIIKRYGLSREKCFSDLLDAANERDSLCADLRDEIEGLRVAAHEYEESGDDAMAAYERRQADRLERILNDGGDHGD